MVKNENRKVLLMSPGDLQMAGSEGVGSHVDIVATKFFWQFVSTWLLLKSYLRIFTCHELILHCLCRFAANEKVIFLFTLVMVGQLSK